jgi:competence protein ComEC
MSCGPLLLLLQPGIPAAGILANVLAAPAAPLGTGLGLVALVLLPVAPMLGEACVFLASVPARWVAVTAEVTAGLPAARWNWPEGWPGALLLTAVEATLLLAWGIGKRHLQPFRRDREGNRRPWRPRSRLSRAGQVAVALLISVALGTLSGPTLIEPIMITQATPRDWEIVACDVGQGDALLLRAAATPHQVLVVDTGDDKERLTACLDRFGVPRIELLVLTHDDRDHVGALGAVINRTKSAIIAPANRRDGEPRTLVDRLRSAEVPFHIGARGDRGSVGALKWEILAPRHGTQPSDSNAASLVLRVHGGEVSTLLLADTGNEEQQQLRALGEEQLRAEVVKVAHHGSRDQDPALPAVVGARYAIVSVGLGNGYGHPAADTLRLYERSGAVPLRTVLHGSVALMTEGDDLRVWAERTPTGGVSGAE